MIKARFCKSKNGYCGFSISGHAGYADEGNDIVCAAVSSAVQMAVNTVTEIIRADAVVKIIGETISLRLKNDGSEKFDSALAVIGGLHFHLSLLSKQYRGTIGIYNSEV